MINENVRDMDSDLKNSIKEFFRIQQGEQYQSESKDFVDGLEIYLKEKGFDLGCVLQYKNK
jgi:hypothetical protein